jgi:hypothetical protein
MVRWCFFSTCVSPPPVRPAHIRFEFLNSPDGGREVEFQTVRLTDAQYVGVPIKATEIIVDQLRICSGKHPVSVDTACFCGL